MLSFICRHLFPHFLILRIVFSIGLILLGTAFLFGYETLEVWFGNILFEVCLNLVGFGCVFAGFDCASLGFGPKFCPNPQIAMPFRAIFFPLFPSDITILNRNKHHLNEE